MRIGQPIVALVVAVAENGVIGRAGALPWRIPTDLKTFRRVTLGKPIVMGRRTYVSIGRPLDGRDNIVITRDRTFSAAGVQVVSGWVEALALATQCAYRRGAEEIAVIGGAEVFRAALPAAGRIYLTRVHAAPEGDVHFPELPPGEWHETARDALPRGASDEYACTLTVLERTPSQRKTAAAS